jgi:leucyl-tRNA synthetase
MRDLGLVEFDEPFSNLLTQGMVLNEIFLRKSGEGRISYYNPADVDIKTDESGRRTGAILRSDGQPVESSGIGTMSKSKNNGVDPQALVDEYGADTARFFMMFASPPEQTLEWSDSGVEGSFRFLRRLWNFAREYQESVKPSLAKQRAPMAGLDAALSAVRREIHLNLRQANFDMGRFQYNTVASACMKMLNAMERAPREADASLHAAVLEEGMSILLRVLSPITPHIGHYLWRELGFGEDILTAAWPEPMPEALVQDEIELVLQVGGKMRGKLRVPAGAGQQELEQFALGHEAVKRHTEGRPVKKVVVVPGRLINVVV